jgi:hypothetical protein
VYGAIPAAVGGAAAHVEAVVDAGGGAVGADEVEVGLILRDDQLLVVVARTDVYNIRCGSSGGGSVDGGLDGGVPTGAVLGDEGVVGRLLRTRSTKEEYRHGKERA